MISFWKDLRNDESQYSKYDPVWKRVEENPIVSKLAWDFVFAELRQHRFTELFFSKLGDLLHINTPEAEQSIATNVFGNLRGLSFSMFSPGTELDVDLSCDSKAIGEAIAALPEAALPELTDSIFMHAHRNALENLGGDLTACERYRQYGRELSLDLKCNTPDIWPDHENKAIDLKPSSTIQHLTGSYVTITSDEIDDSFTEAFLSPDSMPSLFTKLLNNLEHESLGAFLSQQFELLLSQARTKWILLLKRYESTARIDRVAFDSPSKSAQLINVCDEARQEFKDDPLSSPVVLELHTDHDSNLPRITCSYNSNIASNFLKERCSYWVEADCTGRAYPAINRLAEEALSTLHWLVESQFLEHDRDFYRLDDISQEFFGSDRSGGWNSMPETNHLCLHHEGKQTAQGDFFLTMLDAWWSNWTKKDSLQRRLRNAFLFASDARNQENGAIQLALLTSALEALVGDKRPDLTNMIAQRCAVLLEPDPRNRPACQKAIKKLYNTRSRILHGSQTDASSIDIFVMRMVLAATMQAIVGHRLFAERMGVDYNPADFIAELDDHSASGQPLVGTSGQLVSVAWGIPVEQLKSAGQ